MRTSLILAIVLALAPALALSGCIQNMGDLKDRLGGDAADEPVAPAAIDEVEPAPAAEVKVTKPPVARITIFGPNGALVFKSTFQADDPADLLFVEEGSKLNLIASDSEALEAGATLTGFAWTLNGKVIEGARQATIELPDAGVYAVGLLVTDSHGKADTQALKLAVAPKPIEIATELMTGPVAGASGGGQPGEATFTLALADAGVPATITAVKFVSTPPAACDHAMDVTGPDGASLGSKDEASVGAAETITAGALAEGDYAISIVPFACAAPEGIAITVTVTYLPTIDGLGAETGHGAHAGH